MGADGVSVSVVTVGVRELVKLGGKNIRRVIFVDSYFARAPLHWSLDPHSLLASHLAEPGECVGFATNVKYPLSHWYIRVV